MKKDIPQAKLKSKPPIKTEPFEPKSILITGGAGFVGSNVLKFFWKKYPNTHFHVVDLLTYAGDLRNIDPALHSSPRFTFWYGDILDDRLMDKVIGMCDYVLHFAAETHVSRSIFDDVQFLKTDVLGTEVIAHAVLKHKDTIKRFVHISTSEVYGTALTERMAEDHALSPQSPYAAAKVGADRLVYSYYATYKIPAVIVRPFNIFGLNQHPEKVIPRFITSALLGEPLTIHGSGQSQRDFTYTDDLARALDLVLRASPERVLGEVFNVGNDRAISVIEIAKKIKDVMPGVLSDKKFTLTVGDRLGQVERHISNSDKIRKVLGWKPEVSFEDGLKAVIAWYTQNKIWWEPKILMRHVNIPTKNGKVEPQ